MNITNYTNYKARAQFDDGLFISKKWNKKKQKLPQRVLQMLTSCAHNRRQTHRAWVSEFWHKTETKLYRDLNTTPRKAHMDRRVHGSS